MTSYLTSYYASGAVGMLATQGETQAGQTEFPDRNVGSSGKQTGSNLG
jgi:hypothetical protein